MKYTLSALLENKPGVLSRVAGLFTRRGYNIDSLTVGITENKKYSIMTIVVDGNSKIVEQVSNQLRKLIDVIKINNITNYPCIEREMIFIKINYSYNNKERNDIISLTNIFRGRIIDLRENTLIIELTGNTEKIEAFLKVLKKYKIKEIVRTGKIAMLRGSFNDESFDDGIKKET